MRVLPFDAVGGPLRTLPCQPTVAEGILELEMRGWCFDARRV